MLLRQIESQIPLIDSGPDLIVNGVSTGQCVLKCCLLTIIPHTGIGVCAIGRQGCIGKPVQEAFDAAVIAEGGISANLLTPQECKCPAGLFLERSTSLIFHS